MKKIILILLLSYIFALSGCNNTKNTTTAPPTTEETENQKQLSKDITNSIYNSLSEYSKGWIASTEESISCYIQKDSIRVYIRIIAPEMIGRIADESCSSLVEKINNSGYQSYSISYRYYTESNQGGTDDDSMVDWTTKNGETGTFIDEKTTLLKSNATIDDVYEYYDDFAHDTNP